MIKSAELIAVGTELLLGTIVNTDAQILSEALSSIGINVHHHTVVGDNPERLKEVLEIARKRADLIITTGGLGPTYDDLTKQTICKTFGRELFLREDLLAVIRDIYENNMHKDMPACNAQQAMFPKDCTVFDNPVGTAPGCAFEEDGVHVLMLPGPPFECRYMLEHYALPYLKSLSDEVIVHHDLRVFGIGESHIDELLRRQMTELKNPSLAPYAKFNECILRVTAKAATEEEAEAMTVPVIEEVKTVLGTCVYGTDTDSLEQVVLELLKERGETLSAAESCTGGLIAKRITDLSGASRVFRGGVVSYTDGVKHGVLGVRQETLDAYGAVSAEAAREMAEGARRACGSDYALSVTGVAGPDKDDRGNEVGTVYIGLASKDETIVRYYPLGGSRARIRTAAADRALDLLRRRLQGLELN